MRKDKFNSRLILVIGGVLLIILAIVIVLTVNKDNKTDNNQIATNNGESGEVSANTNTDVIKDQIVDEFSFKNTSLIYNNGTSTLETTVTNTGSEDKTLKEFNIIVKDKEGKTLIELTGFIGDTLKAGESKIIDSSCGIDLSSATSIEYEVVE